MESPREAKPLFLLSSPSPLKERGIKGVRLIKPVIETNVAPRYTVCSDQPQAVERVGGNHIRRGNEK